jgi:hypothetical protein
MTSVKFPVNVSLLLPVAGVIVISGAEATSAKKKKKPRKKRHWAQSVGFVGKRWGGGLTLHRQVLARRDGTDAREGDGHDRGGIEGRKKGRDEVRVLEMSLYGGDLEGGVISGLGINEGAQERKSDGGCEEEHGGWWWYTAKRVVGRLV